MAFYYDFLTRFGIADDITPTIVLVFAGVSLFILVLRIIACVGYQTQYAVFKYYGKEIKAKADALYINKGFIGRCVTDYMRPHEKGAAFVSAAAVANKNAAGLGFIFWKYDSISRLVKAYENALVFIGLLLAVFLEHPMFFGVMAISLFLIMQILSSVFDFELAKDRLINEVIIYLEGEIGQFYTPDLNSGLSRLRIETAEASAKQSEVFEKSVKNLSESLKESMRLSLNELAIDKSIAEWKKTLEGAAEFQNGANASINDLTKTAGEIKASAELFNKAVSDYYAGMNDLTNKMNARFDASEFVEKNQALLNDSFNKFEMSLQDITGRFGNSLASIIDHRVQASFDALNGALNDNIRTIVNSNNELIVRLQKIFEAFHEQSALETQAILRIKDQIEIYNDQRN